MTYLLKMFNTGQITIPKKRRDRYATKTYSARETQEGLLISPVTLDKEEAVFYEDEEGFGLHYPKGKDPQDLIASIKHHLHGH